MLSYLKISYQQTNSLGQFVYHIETTFWQGFIFIKPEVKAIVGFNPTLPPSFLIDNLAEAVLDHFFNDKFGEYEALLRLDDNI